MLLRSVSSLPEGPAWSYEITLDEFRTLAIDLRGQNGATVVKAWLAEVLRQAVETFPDDIVTA